ncbi:MAG: hypothetical protein IIZ78_13790 [Clostridiales bacterium]|nr:hypothetical protein [Clostridiales bacterium]
MQKRSWESEKNNRDHDPEHLVHISVVDHVCVGADWNGEVEMGRLIDADMLIAELKESAFHHCNNPREDSLLQRDRVIVRAQPTVEAIPKADYEARLKADMVAMLRFLWNDIGNLDAPICDYASSDCISKWQVHEVIQQKINALKEDQEEEE